MEANTGTARRSPKGAAWLAGTRWTLAESRAAAEMVRQKPRMVRGLMAALFHKDQQCRLRAADTARRLSEKDRSVLARHADALLSAAEETPLPEKRTRWHLALAAARACSTPAQRRRLASTLMQWTKDGSNEVRCCALEGLGVLAAEEPALQGQVHALAEAALLDGECTPAMACRARRVLRMLAKKH